MPSTCKCAPQFGQNLFLRLYAADSLKVHVWSAQDQVYAVHAGLFQRTRKKAQAGDEHAKLWVENYLDLSELLSIRV